jgi:hypothetical protein
LSFRPPVEVHRIGGRAVDREHRLEFGQSSAQSAHFFSPGQIGDHHGRAAVLEPKAEGVDTEQTEHRSSDAPHLVDRHMRNRGFGKLR